MTADEVVARQPRSLRTRVALLVVALVVLGAVGAWLVVGLTPHVVTGSYSGALIDPESGWMEASFGEDGGTSIGAVSLDAVGVETSRDRPRDPTACR